MKDSLARCRTGERMYLSERAMVITDFRVDESLVEVDGSRERLDWSSRTSNAMKFARASGSSASSDGGSVLRKQSGFRFWFLLACALIIT